jgi:hypothetical protein
MLPGIGPAGGGITTVAAAAGGAGAMVVFCAGRRIVTFATGARVEPTTLPPGRAAAMAGSDTGTNAGGGSCEPSVRVDPTTVPPGKAIEGGESDTGGGSGPGSWAAAADGPATRAAVVSHWRIPRMVCLAGRWRTAMPCRSGSASVIGCRLGKL